MQAIMFDIDGTLVNSFEFDEQCFIEAVQEALNIDIDTCWESYPHVTDRGLLMEILKRAGHSMPIDECEAKVKPLFVKKVKAHLLKNSLEPVLGAAEFIQQLKHHPNVALSLATGGWLETAMAKLHAAKIDVSGIPIASSNDHYRRTSIMRLALARSGAESVSETPIYFGDAAWDQSACKELGFSFVLVGNRVKHDPSISDFQDRALASILGLN